MDPPQTVVDDRTTTLTRDELDLVLLVLHEAQQHGFSTATFTFHGGRLVSRTLLLKDRPGQVFTEPLCS